MNENTFRIELNFNSYYINLFCQLRLYNLLFVIPKFQYIFRIKNTAVHTLSLNDIAIVSETVFNVFLLPASKNKNI
jgi:uncharacterized protein YbcV (DUF1398 family)